MTSLRRSTAVTVLCLACVHDAQAQRVPTPADVRARLHADVPAEVAWAAFDAGTHQIVEAVPDLVAVLDSAPAGSSLEERDFLAAAVLDSLIQLKPPPGIPIPRVTAPTEILERYYDRWPIQTLVLLGRNGTSADATLLKLLPSATTETWFAIANLLVPRAPLGFAAEVLRGLKLDLEVMVTDRGKSGGLSSGIGMGVGHGDGIGQQPRGFPPHAIYRLEPTAYPTTIVLSTGPHIAYYSRFVTSMFQFPLSQTTFGGPTAADRLAYLEAILQRSGYYGSTMQARTSTEIEWRTASTLVARIAIERKKIEDAYERTLNQLIHAGLMTADEARALPLTLNVTVNDSRSDRRQRLPDVTSPAR